MQEFLNRSFPIIGEDGLEALSKPLISIAGLGGVGGGTFLNLVRFGVKRFRIAENGIFDPPDMNRQAAAFASTMDKPKIEIYEQLAREINPEIEIEAFPEGTLADNMEKFLNGCDVYIGVIDAEKGADVKAMTPELIRKFNIPLFTAGVYGLGTLLVAHHPDGMMPDEFWGSLMSRSSGNGVLPSVITDRFEPVINERISAAVKNGKMPTTSIGGSLAGTVLAAEVLVYLLRDTALVNRDAVFAPKFIVSDMLKMFTEIIDATQL